jgi:hypothetical protein
MRKPRKKSRGECCPLLFVIPSAVENGAAGKPRDRRAGPEAERTGIERIKSLNISHQKKLWRCLHFGRHDKRLFAPLINPIIHGFVPEPAVLGFKHPMAFVRKVQHFRRYLQYLQGREKIEAL